MNDCLINITNITALYNGVPLTLPVATTLEEQQALVYSLTLPLVGALTIRDNLNVKVLGSLNGCCLEVNYTEVLGACPEPTCTFDLCDYINTMIPLE